MRWQEYNSDLRKLWNLIVDSHSETNSSKIVEKANREANKLMEKLTIKLSELDKNESERYLYSISNNKQIIPRIKYCPICGEMDNNEDQEHILIRYESWQVDFFCDKCGLNGSVEYMKPEDWNPEVEGKEIKF